MDLQPENGFVVDRVVDAKNDIERPHYEFKFHGLVYHLPLREELDSVDYLDILPMANARGFLDTSGTCLLNRSYCTSPKKVDVPTFRMFRAAFLSLSCTV